MVGINKSPGVIGLYSTNTLIFTPVFLDNRIYLSAIHKECISMKPVKIYLHVRCCSPTLFVVLITVCSLAFLPALALGQNNLQPADPRQKDVTAGEDLPLPDIRVGELIGRSVQNSRGDDLHIESQWCYRTIRTQDGTERQIAWEKHQAVIFEGQAEELLARPAYVYDDKHPRGGPTGWGIYSYPAGPKSMEAVP